MESDETLSADLHLLGRSFVSTGLALKHQGGLVPICYDEMTIGGERADLPLPGVTGIAARIGVSENGVVRLDDERVLRANDRFEVDSHRVEVVEAAVPATLEGYNGPHRGQLWPVGPREVTHLGRRGKRHNEVSLEDPTVSRSHARILWRQEFRLIPETSSSPTTVNGEIVSGERKLEDGDLLGLGNTLLRFRRELPRECANGLRIFALGPFEVQVGPVRLTEWKSHVSRFLLAYLAAHSPEPVPLETTLETFWPELEPERSRNNLKTALSNLRKLLSVSESSALFERTPHSLRLLPEALEWHDLAELRKLLAKKDPTSVKQALELYRGKYLEDCYHDWAVRLRDGLEVQLVEAGCELLRTYRETAQWDRVLDTGRKVLALDGCCQEAYQLSMEASRMQGRPEEAVRLYESCKRKLAQELGLEPSLAVEREYQLARL